MSGSYFLSPHVHVCVAGKQVVLLDLERDKYLAVAHPHPIGRWVRGWPRDEVAPPGPVPENNSLLAKMISQGLLVTDPAIGKEAAPVIADQPKVSLVEYDVFTRPRTSVGHLWNFSAAYMAAKWSLKRHPIKEIVRAARLRKSRGAGTAGSDTSRSSVAGSSDTAALRELVTAFVHLRPLFYTAKDACLLDSLTLTHFLARYGVFPTWVFGVRTEPFYAHCWVQQGDFVFNDSADFVKAFSPILVV